jgi:phosphopantetheinyl transferase (holo-ACP synthase)
MRGKVIFGTRELKRMETPKLNKRPFLPDDFLYNILPHGPLLQSIAEINRVDPKLIAIYNNARRRFFSWRHRNMHLPILALEAGFQSLGIMDFIDTGRTGLPFRIKNISIYKQKGKPYYIIGQKKAQKEKGGLFDFKIVTKKGFVLLEIEDYETRNITIGDTSSYLEKLRSHKLRQIFYLPKRAWVEIISLPLLQEKCSREQDFEKTFLHPHEQKEIERYDPKKRIVELAKKFAMKRCLKLVSKRFRMNENQIEEDFLGEPYFQLGRKNIFFTLLKEKDYIFSMMGYKRKIGIALLEKKNQERKAIPIFLL